MVTAGLVGCTVGLARNTLGLLEVEFFYGPGCPSPKTPDEQYQSTEGMRLYYGFL